MDATRYAASRRGLGGYTLPTALPDLYVLNGPANPTDCEVGFSNLNDLAFVEVYPIALSKQIHTDDMTTPHLDDLGHPVPDCDDVGDPDSTPCDRYNPITSIIKPHARPLTLPNYCRQNPSYVDRFSVIDALRNDYYSADLNECPPTDTFHALTPTEMEQRKTFILAHEIGHALGMHHNGVCGNILFEAAGLVYPFTVTFSPFNIDEIRLVPNP